MTRIVSQYFAAFLIVILGIFVYANSLGGDFILDDEFLVKNNRYTKDWSFLPEIFTRDPGEGAGTLYRFYRPLCTLSYLINFSLCGPEAKFYHLGNILLHIMASLSVFFFALTISGKRLFSFFTGVFFVTCPLHAEAVSYISGRADSMALLFMLLSLILYIKSLPSGNAWFYAFSLFCFIAGLFSKENAVILPALILLYHYSFGKKLKAGRVLPFFAIIFIWIFLRFAVLRFTSPSELFDTTFIQRLPGFFAAVTGYLRLLILPFNLRMEYGETLFGFSDPEVITGLIIFASFVTLAAALRGKKRLFSFGMLWFWAALLPVSNIFPVGAYMAEHWLYAPSAGFFMAVSAWLAYLYEKKKRIISVALAVVLTAFYSYLTVRQNAYWRDPVTFYERTIRHAPGSARSYNNLANIYYEKGDTGKAIELYEKAIEADPGYSYAYSNLGNLYYRSGEKEKADFYYRKALKLSGKSRGKILK